MTKKERIIAALNFKEVDRIPFAPLIDGYFLASLADKNLATNILKAFSYIGCEIIERHSPCVNLKHRNIVTKQTISADGKTTDYIITPVGEISQRYYFKNGTMYIEKHYIDSIEDAKVITYVAEHTDYEPQFELFYERVNLIGDNGIASPTAACSPIMETLQTLCGIQNTTYFLLDEEDVMKEMFNALHERNLKYYKMIGQLNCEAIFCYEDTSTTVLSRDWLKDYASPALEDYTKILHSSGKKHIVHMCGKLDGFKKEINELSCNGIDSICPPDTGNVEIWNAMKAFPEKVLIGGIDPVSLVTKSKTDIMNHLEDLKSNISRKKGYILSTGDAVCYGTDIDLLKAINDFAINGL